MINPFSKNYNETNDAMLIQKAISGNKEALNELVLIHEKFIYNLAWKFTNDQNDAKDLTQEVLIIVITKLATFKSKSSFRTWLYRIVFNQFMQSKRKPMESKWKSFDDFSDIKHVAFQ